VIPRSFSLIAWPAPDRKWGRPSGLGQHLPSRASYPQRRDLHYLAARADALRRGSGEPARTSSTICSVHEAMHKHDRFGAAFGTAAREQRDCALMGLEDGPGVGMAAARLWAQDPCSTITTRKRGLNLLFGTLLGHSRHHQLILLHYFHHSIATVERREASVPRHGTQGASLGAWPAAS